MREEKDNNIIPGQQKVIKVKPMNINSVKVSPTDKNIIISRDLIKDNNINNSKRLIKDNK